MTESEVIKEKIKGYSSIIYLQWHITERCEERCRHCYISTANQDLGLSENKRIVDLFASYGAKKNKPVFISFTGGDPLLYENIWDIMKYVVDKNIYITIKGNPHSIIKNKDYAKFLHQIPILSYQMSIDGLENWHDHMRSQGSFENTLNAFKILNQEGITTVAKMTVSQENKDMVPQVFKLCETNLIDFFGISRLVCTSNAALNAQKTLNASEFQEVMKSLWEINSKNTQKIFYDPLWIPYLMATNRISIPNFSKINIVSEGCTIWEDSFSIMANGDLYACSRIPESKLCNCLEIEPVDIDNNKKLYYFRNPTNDFKCTKCKFFYFCRGCRAVAYAQCGNYFAHDPACCYFMEE